MKESTLVKIVTIICCTVIVISAMAMGYDSHLAALAVVGLFGGEKLLRKVFKE